MQVWLFSERYAAHHRALAKATVGVVQDRGIGEDSIFARLLHESGDMDDRDYATYRSLVGNMSPQLRAPDCIVYLDVSPETALERVGKRGRECEKGLPLEYQRKLRQGYERWLGDMEAQGVPVLRLDWSTFQSPSEVARKVRQQLACQ